MIIIDLTKKKSSYLNMKHHVLLLKLRSIVRAKIFFLKYFFVLDFLEQEKDFLSSLGYQDSTYMITLFWKSLEEYSTHQYLYNEHKIAI